MEHQLHPDSTLIDRLGGPTAVGALCKVTSQAVSAWRRDGIPVARRMYLELLRPDVFIASVQSHSPGDVARCQDA
jgi:hypothetical protein